MPLGDVFVWLTVLSEGALLFVAAQTGFIDGPRVTADMATDGWLPRRFASLSDRPTTRDGVILFGAASLALLLLLDGKVEHLVILYAINVFVTFSLTQLAMCRFFAQRRGQDPAWKRHAAVHVVGFALCATILAVTVIESSSSAPG